MERTLEQQLTDAGHLVRSRRRDLSRAIQMRDEANAHVAARRAQLDQAEAWQQHLQRIFDGAEQMLAKVGLTREGATDGGSQDEAN